MAELAFIPDSWRDQRYREWQEEQDEGRCDECGEWTKLTEKTVNGETKLLCPDCERYW